MKADVDQNLVSTKQRRGDSRKMRLSPQNYNYLVRFRGINWAVGAFDRGVKM